MMFFHFVRISSTHPLIPKAQKNPIAPALLSISGYSMHPSFDLSTPNLGHSGTRGVGIYPAVNLKVTELHLAHSSVENSWVRLCLAGSDSLLVGCVYRSPSGVLQGSVNQLEELFQQACSLQASHLIIVGDFNIPHINWESEASSAPASHFSHIFLDMMHDSLFSQHVKHPTR